MVLPPNGPELSCGNVQLRAGSLLRVPVLYDVLVISFSRGEKARRNFRQLERVVSRQAVVTFRRCEDRGIWNH
jgi:hypothetical protein